LEKGNLIAPNRLLLALQIKTKPEYVRGMKNKTQTYGFSMPRTSQKLIASWLLLVALLVFAMVILGGVTRLTNSGLSMVEWRPVTGWLPPIGAEAWAEEFNKYKAFPEYQKVNKGMSLDEFKGIFVFEYSHRLLGRVIGLAFVLPFLAFLLLRKIPASHIPRLLGLLVLGGSQGVMGWLMVKSGLVDHPDVSHYRLTAHLSLACLIFVALLWTVLDLLYPRENADAKTGALTQLSGICLLLVFGQILVGGFVAGLNAGFIYNEWPMMGEGFLPDDLFHLQPWYMNFLENLTTIQFTHRMMAYVVFTAIFWLFLKSKNNGQSDLSRKGAAFLFGATLLQVLLGIWTLIAVVPVTLGALHQTGGMIVLGLATFTYHANKHS